MRSRPFTLAIARLHDHRRRLTFASAGHPPALWVAPGGETRRLESRSMVLGLLENAVDENPVEEVQLSRGDRVALWLPKSPEAVVALYGIMKAVDDERDPLVEWTESDAINRGNASNDIRGTCDGSSLTLEVNGQQLASTTDSEFLSGDVALTATSYESASTQIYFDDVRVSRP